MRILTASVCAFALAVSVPALSQGNSNGDRGGPKAERGNGGGPGNARGNRGNGNATRGDRQANRGADRPNNANRGNGDSRGNGNADRGSRGNGSADRGNRGARNDRDSARGNAGRSASQGNSNRGGNANRGGADFAERRDRIARISSDRSRDRRRFGEVRDGVDRFDVGDLDGRFTRVRRLQRTAWQDRFCPPGLADKNELCMPPGQYRQRLSLGSRYDRGLFSQNEWFRRSSNPLSAFFGDRYDYRYLDGYAYRINPETQLIASLVPVLGGALGIGRQLPSGFDVYNVPFQYRPVYSDGDFRFRYGDNAIYRVDPTTSTILGVSELLTDGFLVGQPLPTGYGTYNLPLGYRDAYRDDDEHLYRYNNGRIYQVDAETQLVLAAVDLLT